MTAGAASAQDTQDGEGTLLEEIVIYGAKEGNTLNDTSSSIAIVTGEELTESAITSFRDAFRRMGNVLDADWTDGGFIIRGVNSEGLVPGGAVMHDLNQAARYADHMMLLKEGRIVAAGSPGAVMTVDLIREVFGISCHVMPDPVSGTPLCLPFSRVHPQR